MSLEPHLNSTVRGMTAVYTNLKEKKNTLINCLNQFGHDDLSWWSLSQQEVGSTLPVHLDCGSCPCFRETSALTSIPSTPTVEPSLCPDFICLRSSAPNSCASSSHRACNFVSLLLLLPVVTGSWLTSPFLQVPQRALASQRLDSAAFSSCEL